MRMKAMALALALVGLAAPDLVAVDSPEAGSLDKHLEPLRPLLGKTWRGAFQNSTPEKPMVDIARWERALNGKCVRMVHSINAGVYGGETLFRWDDLKQAIVFHYFTTAGFVSIGTVSFHDGKIHTREQVSGEAGGVTEVRGTSEITAEGKFHVATEYLKAGTWSPGHEVTYEEAPSATVVFK
jgi:hypothetical protein